MKKNYIENLVTSKKKEDNRVSIDSIVINDAITDEYLQCFRELEQSNINCLFSFEHNVPADSVTSIKKHNLMMKIARKLNIKTLYGLGIGQNILLEVMKTEKPKIVIGNEYTISILGAIGCLGIRLSNLGQLKDLLHNGCMNFDNYKVYYIEINCIREKYISPKDIIFYLCKQKIFQEENIILEFGGHYIHEFHLDEKIQLCGMAYELGVMSVVINPFDTDIDVNNYDQYFSFDVSDIKPMYYKKDEIVEIKRQNGIKIRVDQGFIGGCTLGYREYVKASQLLKGKKLYPTSKLLIAFPTNEMYVNAIENNIMDDFIDSGAIILNSGCGACIGGCQGKIDNGQLMITTSCKVADTECDGEVIYASTEFVIEACLNGMIYV